MVYPQKDHSQERDFCGAADGYLFFIIPFLFVLGTWYCAWRNENLYRCAFIFGDKQQTTKTGSGDSYIPSWCRGNNEELETISQEMAMLMRKTVGKFW